MKLTYLFSTFVLLVSGLVIWSCSQEETDDVPIVYRLLYGGNNYITVNG